MDCPSCKKVLSADNLLNYSSKLFDMTQIAFTCPFCTNEYVIKLSADSITIGNIKENFFYAIAEEKACLSLSNNEKYLICQYDTKQYIFPKKSINEIKEGIYTHYKGNSYKLISMAVDSETELPVVVYKPLYGEGKLWVRPAHMWYEIVIIDGKMTERFTLTPN